MIHRAVEVIRGRRAIKLLADPTRREILRELTLEPQTETQLSKKIRLTKSTVGHHISALRRARLIKIKVAKPGAHGILEKYYEPTAALFIEDYEKIPPELVKDFLGIQMERLRGMFSAFQLMGGTFNTLQLIMESRGHKVNISSDFDLLYELAKETAKQMTLLGEKYKETETDMDGETLLIKMYSEALSTIMTKDIWRRIFENIGGINTLVLKREELTKP